MTLCGAPSQQQRQRAICKLLLLADLALVLLPGPDLGGVSAAALLLLAHLALVLLPGGVSGQQQRLHAICELLLLAHLVLILLPGPDLGGVPTAALLLLDQLFCVLRAAAGQS